VKNYTYYLQDMKEHCRHKVTLVLLINNPNLNVKSLEHLD
jgi:hypothetical protein